MNPNDALAVTMLAVILTGFGVVAMLFLCMARNGARRDLELERLMYEAVTEKNGNPLTARQRKTPRATWEREGDWWKRES